MRCVLLCNLYAGGCGGAGGIGGAGGAGCDVMCAALYVEAVEGGLSFGVSKFPLVAVFSLQS